MTAPTMASGARSGLVLVATAAVLWALIGLFTPSLLDAGMTPAAIGFWRALLGGVCFVVHLLVVRRGAGLPRLRDTALLAGFGLVGVSVFYVALAAAIESGGVSLAWILLYTAPAWVAVGAVVLLREQVDRPRAALVGLTVTGVALVALGGGTGVRVTPQSVGWGLLAGLTYASWYVAGKHLLRRHAPTMVSAGSLLAGAVALAPVSGAALPPPGARVPLAGLVVVSTYLPVLAYYTGLRSAEASRAAIVATIEPVVAVAIGVVVAGEVLGPVAMVGALLVVGAAAVASARG